MRVIVSLFMVPFILTGVVASLAWCAMTAGWCVAESWIDNWND